MTQNEIATIVAATTQSVLAALAQAGIAMPTVTNPATATKKGQGARSKVQEKPKALPDATSTAIDDIMAEASKEAVDNGKTIQVPKDKAILMEYSEKQWAIWGDTKARRDVLKKYGGEKTTKFGTIWGYKPAGVTGDNLAKGWFLPKGKVTEAGGEKKLIADLKKAGLIVTMGESLRSTTEAYRAAHPRDEKPATEEKPKAESKPKATKESKPKNTKESKPAAKVLPIRVETFEGTAHGRAMVETGATFTQYPDNPDLYTRKTDKGGTMYYVCIGESQGVNTFLYLATIPSGKEVPQILKDVANDGVLSAIASGKIKKVEDYVKDAFKSLDNQDCYKWLIEWLAAAA